MHAAYLEIENNDMNTTMLSKSDEAAMTTLVTRMQAGFLACSSPCKLTRVRGFHVALLSRMLLGSLPWVRGKVHQEYIAVLLAAWSFTGAMPEEEFVTELLALAFPESPLLALPPF